MQNQPSPPPKPVSETWRPDLVRLPERTPARRGTRALLRGLARLLLVLCTRSEVRGLENFPRQGPAIVVTNHLGDADAVLVLAALPAGLETFAKIELYDFPILGKLMEWYGVIWLHRGQPDRRALRFALQVLEEGRIMIIAPEGRYSLIQGLEGGSDGAAFLARKADVPIIPIAMTGTQNEHVYGHLRRLRRAPVSLTVGLPFRLDLPPAGSKSAELLQADTRRIMQAIAALLPPGYRGVYSAPSP